MKYHSVVIVGRPNVGKSTLFNRIAKQRKAVVNDREGVTRDLNKTVVEWNQKYFYLVDTGGFFKDEDPFRDFIRDRIQRALKEASVVLFVVDGKTGVTELDQSLVKWMRWVDVPVILVVNKTESPEIEMEMHQFWSLGLGEPLAISAKHGKDISELMEQFSNHLKGAKVIKEIKSDLTISILGHPNVGKSTLVNQLLGSDQMIVSPLAGTTRDSIDTNFNYQGKNLTLIDTAGLRRRKRVKDGKDIVEYFSNLRTIESIDRSDVCLLVLDSSDGLSQQDLHIFNLIQQNKKGLIIVLNKWDTVEKETNTFKEYSQALEYKAPDLAFYPKITISALIGLRVSKLIGEAFAVRKRMKTILGREQVIDYFKDSVARHAHRHGTKGQVVLSRCCQVRVDPLALAFEVNRPDLVDPSYMRYLKKKAYDVFELDGVTLDLYCRRDFKLRTDEELQEYLNYSENE